MRIRPIRPHRPEYSLASPLTPESKAASRWFTSLGVGATPTSREGPSSAPPCPARPACRTRRPDLQVRFQGGGWSPFSFRTTDFDVGIWVGPDARHRLLERQTHVVARACRPVFHALLLHERLRHPQTGPPQCVGRCRARRILAVVSHPHGTGNRLSPCRCSRSPCRALLRLREN